MLRTKEETICPTTLYTGNFSSYDTKGTPTSEVILSPYLRKIGLSTDSPPRSRCIGPGGSCFQSGALRCGEGSSLLHKFLQQGDDLLAYIGLLRR